MAISSSTLAFIAPEKREISVLFTTPTNVGIACTWKDSAISSHSSTSTLRKQMSGFALASSSMNGLITRQGPHQAAVNLMMHRGFRFKYDTSSSLERTWMDIFGSIYYVSRGVLKPIINANERRHTLCPPFCVNFRTRMRSDSIPPPKSSLLGILGLVDADLGAVFLHHYSRLVLFFGVFLAAILLGLHE